MVKKSNFLSSISDNSLYTKSTYEYFNLKGTKFNLEMIIMSNMVIGVLLSQKKWRKLLRDKMDIEIKQYIQKGQESGFTVSFFCLETVDVQKLTCDLATVENDKTAVAKDVLLPRVLYRGRGILSKMNIRKWRYLSQNTDISVISGFQKIKQHYLLEILAAFEETKVFLEQDLADNPIEFCAFGQKKGKEDWAITATYAKRRSSAAIDWEEALNQKLNEISNPIFNKEELIATLNAGSLAIFQCISKYFPELYETGLVFTIKDTGNVCFSHLNTRRRVLRELLHLDKNMWATTVGNSLDIASYHLFRRDRISPIRETIMVKFVEINDDTPMIRVPIESGFPFLDGKTGTKDQVWT